MSLIAPSAPAAAETDNALLSVLLTAESVRDGAASLLQVLAPLFDDTPCAIAARDRDGLTLHTLAEHGAPQKWPERLEPQFALGGNPGVDPGTGAMIAPLRSSGRVIGAVLFGDPAAVANQLRAGGVQSALATAAEVLRVLLARNEHVIQGRTESLRSISAIVESMAHQMSNPLTGASAITQLLAEELQDEGQRAALGQVRHEMGRAFTVLNDILDFQRDTRAHDGLLDLNAVAERVVRFRGYAIRELGIALDLETADAFLPVRADARSLEHALLLSMRFAEQRSHGTVNRRIAVRVSAQASGELAIDITDSSAGDVPAIVVGFYDQPLHPANLRADSADSPDLGLVDSLLRGCGGRLEIRGSKADGTTLSLILPRAYTPSNSPSRSTT